MGSKPCLLWFTHIPWGDSAPCQQSWGWAGEEEGAELRAALVLLGAEQEQPPLPPPEPITEQNTLAQPPNTSTGIFAPWLWHQGPPRLARGRELVETLPSAGVQQGDSAWGSTPVLGSCYFLKPSRF